MAIKNPDIQTKQFDARPDGGVLFAESRKAQMTVDQAAEDVKGLNRAVEGIVGLDETIGDVKAEKLEEQIEAGSDLFYNMLLEERAAIEARGEQYYQNYLGAHENEQIPEAAKQFAREAAKVRGARDQRLISESEVILSQSMLLKNAIRQNPRYADKFVNAANTAGGFGLYGPDVKFLLEERAEAEAARAANSSDWMAQWAIKQYLADPVDYENDPVKFWKDMQASVDAKQESLKATQHMAVVSANKDEANRVFAKSIHLRLPEFAREFQGMMNHLLTQQGLYTEDMLKGATALPPGTNLNQLKTEGQAYYVAFLGKKFKELSSIVLTDPSTGQPYADGRTVGAYLSPTDMQSAFEPLSKQMNAAMDSLGTPEYARVLGTIKDYGDAQLAYSIPGGPKGLAFMKMVGSFQNSPLAQAVSGEMQSQITQMYDYLYNGNTAGAMIDSNGNYTDRAMRTDLQSVADQKGIDSKKSQEIVMNAFDNLRPTGDPDKDKEIINHQGLFLLWGLKDAHYQNVENPNQMIPEKYSDTYLGIMGDKRIVADYQYAPENFKVSLKNAYTKFQAWELNFMRQEYTNEIRNLKNTIYGADAIEMDTKPDGSVFFKVSDKASSKIGDDGLVDKAQYARLESVASELNRTYAPRIRGLVRSQAHVDAVTSGTEPDYNEAFATVKDIIAPAPYEISTVMPVIAGPAQGPSLNQLQRQEVNE